MMTPFYLKAIKARTDKATPGPWAWNQYASGSTSIFIGPRDSGDDATFLYLVRKSDGSEPQKADDADFIAHAREDMPAMLAEIERLNRELYLANEAIWEMRK